METLIQSAIRAHSALALLLTAKGGFVRMSWTRPVKTFKTYSGAPITKSVYCVGRVGIDHDARAKVIEARATGELPAVNAGLPWGEWLAFPWFIQHKGALYVRLYPVEGSRPVVTFLREGAVIDKDSLRDIALASEFAEHNEETGCFAVKAESLTSVRYGGEVASVMAPEDSPAPARPVRPYVPRGMDGAAIGQAIVDRVHGSIIRGRGPKPEGT